MFHIKIVDLFLQFDNLFGLNLNISRLTLKNRTFDALVVTSITNFNFYCGMYTHLSMCVVSMSKVLLVSTL